MFTLYIDDSGTAPDQEVAIATALIIPTKKIVSLEAEWDNLKSKYNFNEFHTSEFVWRNKKSEFAEWDDRKQEQVFSRVRQISLKYAAKAISVAVHKKDYDEVVPDHLRIHFGTHHYSWAVLQLISLLQSRYTNDVMPREWVFQWMGGPSDEKRREIEEVMERAQWTAEKIGTRADYSNYTFKKSAGIPGLQCVDAIGWVSYRFALLIYKKTPLHKFAEIGWREFEGPKGNNGWLHAVTIRRQNLEKSIKQALELKRTPDLFKEWDEYKNRKNKKTV